MPGVSVLIYDQTCAAEKRRRRKRGPFPDPDKRVFINELVCEGCGDCGVQSNCVSVQPLETEFGRKRTIDQSSCNKDFSCLKGFCPSFVTVHGAQAQEAARASTRRPDAAGAAASPRCRRSTGPTPSSSPASAAPASSPSAASSAWRRISKARASASSTWPASRRRAARSTATCASPSSPRTSTPSASRPARPTSCSAATSWWPATRRCWRRCKPGATAMVVNTAEIPARRLHPQRRLLAADRAAQARDRAARPAREHTHFVDATRLATALLGNSIGANIFMLGYAYQLGALPLSADAIEQAIELNGEAVAMNLAAFRWGRRAALDPRRGRGAGQARAGDRERRAAAVAVVRRDGRAARRVPHRLSERRLCGALPRAGRARCKAAEAAKAPGKMRARRSGRALSVQADGLQGRVRGRAALHRRHRSCKQVDERVRRRQSRASNSISRRRCSRASDKRHRRAAQDDVRPVDAAGVPAAGEAQVPARHAVRSVRLFGASAGPSAS